MEEEDKQLRNVIGNWKQPKPKDVDKLGDIVKDFMDNRVGPGHTRFGLVVELWDQLLSVELGRHCKLMDLSAGQLKVQVDSPVYASELRWCTSELLEQLQRQCPRARIRKIKVVVS